MSFLQDLVGSVSLPPLFAVVRNLRDDRLDDPGAEVFRAMDRSGLKAELPAGGEVAIAVGSRGISALPEMVRAVAGWFSARGCRPFVIPAMGSHGNACAEGQREVLASLGITEANVGCPLRSNMDVVDVGRLEDCGLPVWVDAMAARADGIFVVNRVKPHTAFSGRHESGLVKMLSIGLGKQRGAESCHALGYGRFDEIMPSMATLILDKVKILGGLGIVENAFDHPCRVEVARNVNLLECDAALLEYAKAMIGRLPVEQLDVLLIWRMGKEISGGGVDPNVTGRAVTPYKESFLHATKIGVLRLTPASHGNATGVGTCDVITRRLFNDIDLEATYANVVTSTMLRAAYIPVIMDTDEMAVRCLLKTCNAPSRTPRLIYLRDTLSLERFWATKPVAAELSERADCQVGSEPVAFRFDGAGEILAPDFNAA